MKPAVFPEARDAEAAFYEAFERADLEAMMAVWADRDDILCIHPSGPRLSGVQAVRESWREIFRAGPRLRFFLEGRRIHESAGLVLCSLQEHIQVAGEEGPRHMVLATNVYLLTPGGWRMLAHHASALPSPRQGAPAESLTLH